MPETQRRTLEELDYVIQLMSSQTPLTRVPFLVGVPLGQIRFLSSEESGTIRYRVLLPFRKLELLYYFDESKTLIIQKPRRLPVRCQKYRRIHLTTNQMLLYQQTKSLPQVG